jgi:GNAT superfamily N-acetyltransferase
MGTMAPHVDGMAIAGGAVAVGDVAEISVRPITPGDAGALELFHRRLSQRTVYLRYFYPHPVLSPREIAHLTDVDGRDRLALVVEHDGELIAVGRYDRIPGSEDAEVAFVVADAFQHRGIGTLLLRRLAEAARPVGITHLRAEVLAENRNMLDVFLASGFSTETTRDCGTVELRMSIVPGFTGGCDQPGTLQTTRVPPAASA